MCIFRSAVKWDVDDIMKWWHHVIAGRRVNLLSTKFVDFQVFSVHINIAARCWYSCVCLSVRLSHADIVTQEAQTTQRDRATCDASYEFVSVLTAAQLNVKLHSKGLQCTWVTLNVTYTYIATLLNSAIPMTLKVTQGHWKWRYSIISDRPVWLPISGLL